MIDVFLLLGSNLGDRRLYLQKAAEQLELRVGNMHRSSSVYRTESWGKSNSPDYLNQVLLLQTKLSARELLNTALAIEAEYGRERQERWGNRTLDIDLLLYGEQIINEPGLVVPHPQLHNRRFTLEPLSEIAPTLIHPVLHKTILMLKNEVTDDLDVKKVYF